MKKRKEEVANYLDYIPKHSEKYEWKADGKDGITIFVENKGVFHFLAQKFLGKPKVSQIQLEEMGSFIWLLIDGKRSIGEIGVLVKEHFGEHAEPLYSRLVQYIRNLEDYGFINVSVLENKNE